jgi:hypothetical protein
VTVHLLDEKDRAVTRRIVRRPDTGPPVMGISTFRRFHAEKFAREHAGRRHLVQQLVGPWCGRGLAVDAYRGLTALSPTRTPVDRAGGSGRRFLARRDTLGNQTLTRAGVRRQPRLRPPMAAASRRSRTAAVLQDELSGSA